LTRRDLHWTGPGVKGLATLRDECLKFPDARRRIRNAIKIGAALFQFHFKTQKLVCDAIEFAWPTPGNIEFAI
jgi:hypothetical protein